MMELAHFSNADDLILDDRQYVQKPDFKPRGFWVSDETESVHGWSTWCADEQYGLGRHRYAVEIYRGASVLTLSTAAAIEEFHKEFNAPPEQCFIDWPTVAERFAGIVITPYQWPLRLSHVRWYYGWDCASGCIWDTSAISSVTRCEVPA